MDEYKIDPPYKAGLLKQDHFRNHPPDPSLFRLEDGVYVLAGELWKANKDFRYCFGISIQTFYDSLATILFKKVSIDTFRFDDYLHGLYGDYEREGKTLEDIILEKYGEQALKLIKELI